MADEKTEEPSDHKLGKAHEEGNFPKSAEFASAIVFAVVLMMIVGGGKVFLDRMRALIRVGLDFKAGEMQLNELWNRTGFIYDSAVWLILPVALVSAAAGLLGMVAQVGFHVSFKPVAPNLENISPAKGIKQLFSIKAVFELLQMLVRAIVIGAVAWWLIRSAIKLFAGAAYQTVPVIGELAWNLVTRLLEYSLLAFLVMSGLDYALQRWQFMKGQRMSKDEVKREYKESEGDPLIKSARMQFAREGARSGGQSMQHAKAILTNPTHYAVALAYEPGIYDVPVIVARGQDEGAKEIREAAARMGIPILSNPPLARALFKIGVDRPIPREYFAVVAALLNWLRRIDAMNESRVGIAAAPGALQ